MEKTKYDCLLRMLSIQCTLQSLKRNLRCLVSVHSSKNTETQNILKIVIVLFSKMVIKFRVFKFRAIFCLRVLNFSNFLNARKSRNLILLKIRKNKVILHVAK